MNIVKNLKDYKLDHKQRVFVSFLRDNIDSYSCSEKITNKAYMRKYFSPDNDFLVYCTGVADPSLAVTKKIG